ncbi:MAG TPA: hypothetical protein VHY35_11685 [Stellaceae bacterium]|jgi:hypothetical protein|nr:hypothetical protein [Stellaceae bacterium]
MARLRYLKGKAVVTIATAISVLIWVFVFAVLLSPNKARIAPSPKDLIAYYSPGGECERDGREYLNTTREIDADLERAMAKDSPPGWREGAALRAARRRVQVLEVLTPCWETEAIMKASMKDTITPPAPAASNVQKIDDATFQGLLNSSGVR